LFWILFRHILDKPLAPSLKNRSIGKFLYECFKLTEEVNLCVA